MMAISKNHLEGSTKFFLADKVQLKKLEILFQFLYNQNKNE
jgi:hypothetical protein